MLDSAADRLLARANATWKVFVIERWRAEHAGAEQMREAAAKAETAQGTPADREWQRVEYAIRAADLDEAQALASEFLSRFPAHADARFMLARLLLEQDDDRAADELKLAMQHSSALIAPSLQRLLEYYRDAGRDEEADPIQQRLNECERTLARAWRERMTVTRRDQCRTAAGLSTHPRGSCGTMR